MSLAMLRIGEVRRVLDFRGKDEMKKHLRDLGFIKGESVQVVGENPSGLILMIKGAKIALNRGLASMIMVE
ncbi:MAG: FeoA family protein [Herbinix sp.]|jgi:ferrous iron transport protein A|nr:FeoA family protein [Herbinix sp.]